MGNLWEKVASGLVFIGLAAPLYFQYVYYHQFGLLNIQEQGALGPISDWIGGTVTPFIAIASFILLYKTYQSQKDELGLTREEMIESRKQLIEQNKTLKKQRFENTFFHMLTLHHDIVKVIDYGANSTVQGRKYFSIAYIELMVQYNKKKSNINKDSNGHFNYQADILAILKAYKKFYKVHQECVGHYFRNLYNIIKFIDESNELSEEDKMFYSRLLRAQLSSYELVLLFYNCLAGHGFFKLRNLVNKYNILDNMNAALLEHGHKGYYNEEPVLKNLHQSLGNSD